MDRPVVFKRLTLLYFAAASYSEAARRLRHPELAPGFLLHAHPGFGPGFRACADLASDGANDGAVLAHIDRIIEPFDIAGFLDRSRADWYAIRADDLFRNASKLEASAGDIQSLLERCGFVTRPPAGAGTRRRER